MEEVRLIQGREELSRALSLCRRVFDEFVAPGYSQEGRDSFYRVTELGLNLAALDKGLFAFYGAYRAGELMGVGAAREGNYIMLLFVDKAHHGRGVARALVDRMIAEAPGPVVTVNATDYGAAAYERMGFERTGERTAREGIVYTPMAYRKDGAQRPISLA